MKKFLVLCLIVIIGIATFALFNSALFESSPPTIHSKNEIYWNYKDPLKIKITDDSGIQNYRVYMNSSKETLLLDSVNPEGTPKEVEIEIDPPKNTMFMQEDGIEIEIVATDSSLFFGNSTSLKIQAKVDTKRPQIEVIAHSYKITKGGAAFVVFRAIDDNLSNIVIKNGQDEFVPVYFADDGYYAALLNWNIKSEGFSAQIFAKDKAGNVSSAIIPFYRQNKKYRESTIKVDDSFLEGKVSSLIQEVGERELQSFNSLAERLTYINQKVRGENESNILRIGQAYDTGLVNPQNFRLTAFYPLRNGAAVAGFGDHRFFSYNNEIISESYHLGIDFASVKQAPIVITNGGVVTFAGFNGIYGNMVLIHHGMGLMSLYAHMTQIDIKEGDRLEAGTTIGKTGLTGLVLGDHLHFGITIQGLESNTAEWLDKRWLQDNIFRVIENANKLIQSRTR
ncbi:hypothetical protein CCZ01_06075 [Helicobacter monodelphidis]|uniref:M23 family metallopeptidase n=1 Tax=Helicobacter sp. 15-1451 TaxID=2004995 RepID=UPI000DCB3571|nr:M23 family metallopeptidase [Helicobacter sp. 15-1451]RAX57402.1 hypothetical protein CCZ01_06075 [Helicobacter sp. 15-1451]